MPTLSLTNQVASQALRGEDVIVTLSSAQQSNLASLQVGQYLSNFWSCCIRNRISRR
jgi:hypothetical protein